MSKLFNIIFAFLLLSACIPGLHYPEIKLYQKGTETDCTHGLISGDTVVFTAEVNYTKDPTMKHVHIYIKKISNHLPDHRIYNLNKDCDSGLTDCRRTHIHHAVITIKVYASKEYNGARIHGMLITSNSEKVDSKILQFPEIYDPNKSTELGLLSNSNSNCFDLPRCLSEILISVFGSIILLSACAAFFYIRQHPRTSKYIKRLKRTILETNNTDKSDSNEPLVQVTTSPGITQSLKTFTCVQNSGHKNYYPASEFELENIDTKYRDIGLYNLIKDIAHLTVSVLVSFKSPDRPNIDQSKDDKSPNHYISEKKGFRLKSGMIVGIGIGGSNCPCQKCKIAGMHSSSWGKVLVLTSSTVVYDKNEAEKSSFNLFYDSQSNEAITLYGLGISVNNVNEGWCIVECATCDFNLLDDLEHMIKRCSFQMTELNKSSGTTKKNPKFVCIASHPHDVSKQITVGYWKRREVVTSNEYIDYTRYQYTTPACHGSTGAFVYILGVSDISAKQYHVHLGVKDSYNYSSIGTEHRSH